MAPHHCHLPAIAPLGQPLNCLPVFSLFPQSILLLVARDSSLKWNTDYVGPVFTFLQWLPIVFVYH